MSFSYKLFFNNINWLILKRKIKAIKLVVFDVDGVLTDGKFFTNKDGEVSKSFNAKDGLGIKLIKKIGIKVAFISGANHEATLHRARQLKVDECEVGIKNKKESLFLIQKRLGIKKMETAFVGDDINDLVVKNHVGLFFAPRDASKFVLKKADICLSKNGGDGAARELCEKLFSYKSSLDHLKFGLNQQND